MGDIHYEKHVENLIKMRSELRSAVGSYKIGNTGAEMYFMCRAKAVADALGISTDEFNEHKALKEKQTLTEARLKNAQNTDRRSLQITTTTETFTFG